MPVATILLWDHWADVVVGIAQGIGHALRVLGFDVRYLSVMDANLQVKWPEVVAALRDPEVTGCDLAVSIGGPPLGIDVDGRWLFDLVGKQFFLFSLDSLFYDISRVLGVPEFLQAAKTSPRLGILSPDRDSCEVINTLAPHAICTYLPFGGLLRPVVAAERLDRIAVIGAMGHELAVAPSEVGCEQLALEAPATLGVADARLVEFAREIERPGFAPSITKLATAVLGLPAETLYTVEVARYLSRIDAYQKWHRRAAAVAALRDIPVDVFGPGWEPHTAGLRDCRHLGSVPYRQVPEICRRYRVILNFDPNWGYGLHDRVYTGVANGARVLTNTSRAIADLRLPEKDAVFVYDVNHPDTRSDTNPDMGTAAARALSLPPMDPDTLLEFRSSNSWLARMDAFLAGPRGRLIAGSVGP